MNSQYDSSPHEPLSPHNPELPYGPTGTTPGAGAGELVVQGTQAQNYDQNLGGQNAPQQYAQQHYAQDQHQYAQHQQHYAQQPFAQPYPAQNGYGQYYGQPMTDHTPQSGGMVAFAWIAAVLTAFYMLPWAIAATRGKANMATIGLINLLLGWSLIAWVISLVMALSSHRLVAVAHSPVHVVVAQQFAPAPNFPAPSTVPAGWYPAPSGNGQEYWDGSQWTGHLSP